MEGYRDLEIETTGTAASTTFAEDVEKRRVYVERSWGSADPAGAFNIFLSSLNEFRGAFRPFAVALVLAGMDRTGPIRFRVSSVAPATLATRPAHPARGRHPTQVARLLPHAITPRDWHISS